MTMSTVFADRRELRSMPSKSDSSMLGGVCSGIAYAFAWPVVLVRLVTALLVFGTSYAAIAYLILSFVMPDWTETPNDYPERTK